MTERIYSKNFDLKIEDLMNNCIPSCVNIYFRVSFFYFARFSLIANAIKNKNIKILIGLSTDTTTAAANLVNKSIEEIQNNYLTV